MGHIIPDDLVFYEIISLDHHSHHRRRSLDCLLLPLTSPPLWPHGISGRQASPRSSRRRRRAARARVRQALLNENFVVRLVLDEFLDDRNQAFSAVLLTVKLLLGMDSAYRQ